MTPEQRDPAPAPEHLVARRAGDAATARALALVRHLRARCPWDARQTSRTLVPFLLEEADEVVDAILRDDDDELRDELGDLLLNLAFQVVLAEERGAFDAPGVVEALEEKMRVRHPHVYGDADAPPPWEETKAEESGDGGTEGESPGEGTAAARPAGARGGAEGAAGGTGHPVEPLHAAHRIQARAALVGFDWPDASGALAKLREEIGELEDLLGADGGTAPGHREIREEVGDLLFAAVNVARLADVAPGSALRDATGKFGDRFRRLLREAEARGLDPVDASLEELESLWREIKAS